MHKRLPSALFLLISVILVPFLNAFSAKAQAPLPLLPLPSHAEQHSGTLALDAPLDVVLEGYTEPRLERARDRFLSVLARKTGILPIPVPPGNRPKLLIKTSAASAPVQQLGEDESYKLTVTRSSATLSAVNPLGAMHGLQTFLQLVDNTPSGFDIPAVTIEDKPRFPWRGLMIDTGRHFMPLDIIRQNLNAMEVVKMNVFHWHLSDDQGFRVESKTYPLLQEKGSDGLYYTQAQVHEIIEYARDRGIRVVPEFDMPGHATSWFVGYPQLASGNGPYTIERHWGIFDPAMDPTRESTYQFLESFLAEMTALFPDAYFHIGGDECNGKEWDANPRINKYMREHHIADNAALQAYFTSRVQELVSKDGKITVGWDEVLQPETPHTVVIQSWRGQKALAQAAQKGYRGLLSAGYYLDLNWSAQEHYAVDPLESATGPLSAEEAKSILGGEAAMWTEFITPENINFRTWPRAAAVAERLWSPQGTKDINSMYQRLALLTPQLAYQDLDVQSTHGEMMQRLSGGADTSRLQVLAGAVQPPRNYTRGKLRDYDAFTPLNHLVDAIPAESDAAREFTNQATRIAAGKGTPEDWSAARLALQRWRDNDALVQPLLARSALTEELVPVSHDLARTASLGLEALDHLQKDTAMQAQAHADELSELRQLKKPKAVVVDEVVPSVERLVQAVRTR